MIAVCGEALIDLLASPTKNELKSCIGGGPFNTALAIARLGGDVGFYYPISTDYFGKQILDYMKQNNLVYSCPYHSDLPTTLAVSNLNNGVAQYKFYRLNTSQTDIRTKQIIDSLAKNIDIIHSGGLVMIDKTDTKSLKDILLSAKKQNALVSIDPNVRAGDVDDFDSYRDNIKEIIAVADIVKLSDEDINFLYPSLTTEEAFDELYKEYNNISILIMTSGPDSVLCKYKNQQYIQQIQPVKIIDTIGAGDSFIAGFLFKLQQKLKQNNINSLDSEEVKQCLEMAIKVASFNCQQQGCQPPFIHQL